MARIRTIKPEFFTSLTISSLPFRARLTFVGLWTQVDDSGRWVDDARLVRAAIWPLDDVTLSDVEDDLKEIASKHLITRYEVAGRRYLHVRGLNEHQRINKPTPSKLPAPPGQNNSRSTPVAVDDPYATSPEPFPHDSPPERKGTERKGVDRNQPPRASARDYVPDYESDKGSEDQNPETSPSGIYALPKAWCNEHGCPDDKDCTGCLQDHGDVAHFAKLRLKGGSA